MFKRVLNLKTFHTHKHIISAVFFCFFLQFTRQIPYLSFSLITFVLSVCLTAVPFPRMHPATALASLPAPPGHQEPLLASRSHSASTARQTLQQHLRRRRNHATTDDNSTATFNTCTRARTVHRSRPSSPHSSDTNNLPHTATHNTDCLLRTDG